MGEPSPDPTSAGLTRTNAPAQAPTPDGAAVPPAPADAATPDPAATAASDTAVVRASRPVKRSFSIRGHRTSISLEAAFWDALGDVARARQTSMAQLVATIDAARGDAGLSSAVRIYILDYYRAGDRHRAP